MTALQAGAPSTITSEPDNIYAIEIRFASPEVRDQGLIELRAMPSERDSLREALQDYVDAHAVPSTACKERAAYEKAIAALALQEQA